MVVAVRYRQRWRIPVWSQSRIAQRELGVGYEWWQFGYDGCPLYSDYTLTLKRYDLDSKTVMLHDSIVLRRGSCKLMTLNSGRTQFLETRRATGYLYIFSKRRMLDSKKESLCLWPFHVTLHICSCHYTRRSKCRAASTAAVYITALTSSVS
jgi:hypothetical protein